MLDEIKIAANHRHSFASVTGIAQYGTRWQCIFLLASVLNEIRGGLRKSEALSEIYDRKFFNVQAEDLVPYWSAEATTREPRWKTLIAWSRKDMVERGMMYRLPRDNWDLTGRGRDFYQMALLHCRAGKVDVARCYLWTPKFKSFTAGEHYKGPHLDHKRPLDVYKDTCWLSILDTI